MIDYDPDRHPSFVLDGEPLVSVSRALDGAGFGPNGVPPAILEAAATRGKHIHAACTLAENEELDWDALDPDYAAPVQAWLRWLKDTGAIVIAQELPVYHPTWRYGGILDRLLSIDGQLVVPEIKTGRKQKGHRLQTAAYAMTDVRRADTNESLFSGASRRRCAVYLTDTATVVAHDDPDDYQAFLGCLTVAQWRAKR